ncbi:hypothetical protein PTR02_23355 [Serratia nevei]|uniref:hypothetical protein n=1 Tax=Serratia nevei TaxID=2703794 RepID=UPI00313ADAE8
MDKFSELKRMAEKCPVQRFEPFIGRAGGRGTQAIFNADTKGEVITWSGFDSSDVTSRTGREAIARFVAAVDPETVLSLLAALEFEKQNNSGVAGMVEDYETKLEAKDERIAELEEDRRQLNLIINSEANRADAAEKRVAELSELETQVKVWESAATKHLARAEEAEKRLATPVRLPEAHSTLFRQHIRSDYKSLQAFKADEVIAALREQGFTVEGDEQS